MINLEKLNLNTESSSDDEGKIAKKAATTENSPEKRQEVSHLTSPKDQSMLTSITDNIDEKSPPTKTDSSSKL